jgi:hypothetical protein
MPVAPRATNLDKRIVLPAAVAHNPTVKVWVDGEMYDGRCCETADIVVIAFADGDWRQLLASEAIAALERGDIVAAGPSKNDSVEGFLFTTDALGRQPRVGGALVGRHPYKCFGLDNLHTLHYVCLRSFEPDEVPEGAPRTRRRSKAPVWLDRQGLRTFRFCDIVYESLPAEGTAAAAAAVAVIVIQHGERNPETNKMSQKSQNTCAQGAARR